MRAAVRVLNPIETEQRPIANARGVSIVSIVRGSKRGERVPELPIGGVTLQSTQGDAAVLLPRIGVPGSLRSARTRAALMRPIYGPLALGVLVAATVLVVVVASAAPTMLVGSSHFVFPNWISGPLHGLFGSLLQRPNGTAAVSPQVIGWGISGVFALMFAAYGVALASARTLSMRAIAITVAALYAFLVLSPPLGLTDVFNYLGYARLGALHGLNPYTHIIRDEYYDPVYMLVSWRHYPSPYGQLFTLFTYPLGWMSLPGALWVLKVGLVALFGVFVALVGKCARQLGYDPRFAVLFVALNPVILIWDVGGFHNDPLMLVPMMAAISLVIARRYRWAGAALAVAVAVKVTIVLLLPFLMLAAYRHRRSLQVLVGFVLGAIPLTAVSVAAFGFSMPNVTDQSRIVTPLSVVNLAGVLLHLGGASPLMEDGSKLLLVLVVAGLLAIAVRRGRPDWLTGAGWATLALLVCTSWLMPWYIVWALPLVALSTSPWLRRAMLALSVFAAFTFLPVTTNVLWYLHVNVMRSTPDRIANAYLRSVQH